MITGFNIVNKPQELYCGLLEIMQLLEKANSFEQRRYSVEAIKKAQSTLSYFIDQELNMKISPSNPEEEIYKKSFPVRIKMLIDQFGESSFKGLRTIIYDVIFLNELRNAIEHNRGIRYEKLKQNCRNLFGKRLYRKRFGYFNSKQKDFDLATKENAFKSLEVVQIFIRKFHKNVLKEDFDNTTFKLNEFDKNTCS